LSFGATGRRGQEEDGKFGNGGTAWSSTKWHDSCPSRQHRHVCWQCQAMRLRPCPPRHSCPGQLRTAGKACPRASCCCCYLLLLMMSLLRRSHSSRSQQHHVAAATPAAAQPQRQQNPRSAPSKPKRTSTCPARTQPAPAQPAPAQPAPAHPAPIHPAPFHPHIFTRTHHPLSSTPFKTSSFSPPFPSRAPTDGIVLLLVLISQCTCYHSPPLGTLLSR